MPLMTMKRNTACLFECGNHIVRKEGGDVAIVVDAQGYLRVAHVECAQRHKDHERTIAQLTRRLAPDGATPGASP